MPKIEVKHASGFGIAVVVNDYYVAIIKFPWHRKRFDELAEQDYYYNLLLFRVHFCTVPKE
jgi:hypothetical protein